MTGAKETGPLPSYRSTVDTGHDGFTQLVRAELTKFRSVRGWVLATGAAALVLVALSYVSASGSHTGTCYGATPATTTCTPGHPAVPTGPGGEPVTDSFTFVHRALAGDGSVTVRVTSLTGDHATSNRVGASPSGKPAVPSQSGLPQWAKAGILVQEAAYQGAGYAAVMVTGSHGVRMQYDYTHDRPGLNGLVGPLSPRWLRLSRHGDVITGYDSPDGSNWAEIGTARLASLPATVQIGLFVTSPVYFDAGASNGHPSLATATFDRLRTRGAFLGAAWTGGAIGANAFYPTFPSTGSWQRQSQAAFTLSGSGDIAPLVGGGTFGNDFGASILVGGLAALIVLIVLATLSVTSEYRRGLIRTTLVASPRRGRVVAAKAIVVGTVAFLVGLVGTTLAEMVARHVFLANGNYLFPFGTWAEVRVVVGTALVFALVGVMALALGTALRRSAAAVVTSIVILVLPFILGTTLPAGASDWLMRLTPTAAFAVQGTLPRSPLVADAYTPLNGYYPLGPWTGLAVLCGYCGVALALAVWAFRQRDV